MAAGETELTFVRCSNCRSLVPAMANRCRMCGNSLAAKDEGNSPDGEGQESRGRVRQRTISVSPAEVSTLKESVFPESPKTQGDPVSSSLLEEHHQETTEPTDFQDEEFSEISSQVSSYETSFQEDEQVDEHDDDDEFIDDSLNGAEEAPTGDGVPQYPAERARKKRRRKKKNRRHPLAEGVGEFAQTSPSLPVQEPAHFDSSNNIENGGPSMEASAHSTQPRQRVENEIPVKRVEEGMLFGWFVNFSQDPRGAAREIRIGQCFLGSQRLRDTDIVIGEETVSTPHCLIRASADDGLIVQDLMSERGTFVKRRNTHNYVQCFESARVEHGDWLRLGNFEIMVCLLPRSERR